MTPQGEEALELQRALVAHLKMLDKMARRHGERRGTWVDQGLGSWEQAKARIDRRRATTRRLIERARSS